MNQQELTALLAGMSVVVALEGAWLAAVFKPPAKLHWLKSLPVIRGIKLLYYGGLPYLALVTGLLPARFFGLRGLEQLTLSSGAAIVADAVLWAGKALAVSIPDVGPVVSVGGVLGLLWAGYVWLLVKTGVAARPFLYASKAELWLDVAHWAFYRAAAWFIVDDIYVGTVLGLGLVLFEDIACSRIGKFSETQQQNRLLKAGLAVIVSITFIFVQNLWLITALHFVLAVGGRGVYRYYQKNVRIHPQATNTAT